MVPFMRCHYKSSGPMFALECLGKQFRERKERGNHSLSSFLFILYHQPFVFADLSGVELPLTDGL